ncbi:MAG: hypothetical protein IPP79_07470 [Chitinophagaceae bacterium]|nr:hypothetical protein [Chitinophagaceae bacterium]
MTSSRIFHNRTLLFSKLQKTNQGNLWLAFGEPFGGKPDFLGGLYKFEKKTGKFTHYKADPKNPTSLQNPNVTAVFEDSKGILWVGAKDNGLYQLDRKTGHFTRFPYDPSDPTKLSSLPHTEVPKEDFITFIMEDKKGKSG